MISAYTHKLRKTISATFEKCTNTLKNTNYMLHQKSHNSSQTDFMILGHYIDNQGIHADPKKIQKIQEWATLTTQKSVERFVATVNYIAQFMPQIASHLGLLTNLLGKQKFY